MGSYKYLLKNVGILTVSNFVTKLLAFFLIPLYTNILTTIEYGIFDIFNTSISILIPLLTLGISEAIILFLINKEIEEKSVITISIKYLLLGSLVIALLLIINYFLNIIPTIKDYSLFFFLMFFSQTLTNITTAYARGKDKLDILSISNIIACITIISFNILFLLVFKTGLSGYFLANILSFFIQSIYIMFKLKIFNDIDFSKDYKTQTNKMLSYSKPTVVSSIGWWINNASDKYVVTYFCGLAENGIYSIASKIPSMLNVIQNIFNQAWVLSATKELDKSDSNNFFSNIYRIYNFIIVMACSLIIVFDKLLSSFLYANDFYDAWRYVPWLTLAIIFGALSGFFNGIYVAVKDSKGFAKYVAIGAITNIILNIIFTPLLGALGAAIATTISYFVIWLFIYINSKKYISLRMDITRNIISYVLLVIQSIILLFIDSNITLYTLELLILITLFIIYFKDFKLLLSFIRKR